MSIDKIHHINFVVRNLQESVERFRKLLGIEEFIFESLPQRGVNTARVALGEQWLVLVQPVNSDSVAGRHLAAKGEGFFLISFAVDDLEEAANIVVNEGGEMTSSAPRPGLLDWLVWDIDSKDTFGVQVQFCKSENEC